jgi:hypothetical protein
LVALPLLSHWFTLPSLRLLLLLQQLLTTHYHPHARDSSSPPHLYPTVYLLLAEGLLHDQLLVGG